MPKASMVTAPKAEHDQTKNSNTASSTRTESSECVHPPAQRRSTGAVSTLQLPIAAGSQPRSLRGGPASREAVAWETAQLQPSWKALSAAGTNVFPGIPRLPRLLMLGGSLTSSERARGGSGLPGRPSSGTVSQDSGRVIRRHPCDACGEGQRKTNPPDRGPAAPDLRHCAGSPEIGVRPDGRPNRSIWRLRGRLNRCQ